MATGRALLWGLSVVLATLASGCRPAPPGEIQLSVGNTEAEHVSFAPRSAFAEYLQLPGEHNELRVTLAGYEASCERYVPPEPGRASVTVTIVTPAGSEPRAGSYAWAGHELHGGTAARPEHPYAIPTARIGRHSYVFPPGGSITLTRVELTPHGSIEGLLAFAFPGDADHAAMRASGRFSARICRLDKVDSP